tara:strand:+ start:887 stop:1096 length:210 start_codon:yes stop_codon:yes gene_type:complete
MSHFLGSGIFLLMGQFNRWDCAAKMVSKDHKLGVRRACTLLTLASSIYYEPMDDGPAKACFMTIIYTQF